MRRGQGYMQLLGGPEVSILPFPRCPALSPGARGSSAARPAPAPCRRAGSPRRTWAGPAGARGKAAARQSRPVFVRASARTRCRFAPPSGETATNSHGGLRRDRDRRAVLTRDHRLGYLAERTVASRIRTQSQTRCGGRGPTPKAATRPPWPAAPAGRGRRRCAWARGPVIGCIPSAQNPPEE